MEPSFAPFYAAIVAALAAVFAARHRAAISSRTEAARAFMEICAHAHGRPAGRDHIGVAEQLAAVRLVMELGDRFTFLREPARVALKEIGDSFIKVTAVRRVPEEGEPYVEVSKEGMTSIQISDAAKLALAHLPEHRRIAVRARRWMVRRMPGLQEKPLNPDRRLPTGLLDVIHRSG